MDERIEDERLSAEYLEEGAALFLLLGRLFHGVPDPVLFAEAANDRIFDEMPFVRGEEALRAGACAHGRIGVPRPSPTMTSTRCPPSTRDCSLGA